MNIKVKKHYTEDSKQRYSHSFVTFPAKDKRKQQHFVKS